MGNITKHWLLEAHSRIKAGESETEVLLDYGYIPEKDTSCNDFHDWGQQTRDYIKEIE